MSAFKKFFSKKPREKRDMRYPVWPPPDPEYLNANPRKHLAELRHREFRVPKGTVEDNPLSALYLLYEYIFIDDDDGYNDQLGYFWGQSTWRVSEIPDPKDDNPARYAALACCANILSDVINIKMYLGFPRGAEVSVSAEQYEAYQAKRAREKIWEEPPAWALNVPPLEKLLTISSPLWGTPSPRDTLEAFALTKNIRLRMAFRFFLCKAEKI